MTATTDSQKTRAPRASTRKIEPTQNKDWMPDYDDRSISLTIHTSEASKATTDISRSEAADIIAKLTAFLAAK